MNLRNRWSATIALSLLLIGAIASLSGQPPQNTDSAAIQKAVLSRLMEIQKAAEALNSDKVFSFVLENNAGALAQNGKLFLLVKQRSNRQSKGFSASGRSIINSTDRTSLSWVPPWRSLSERVYRRSRLTTVEQSRLDLPKQWFSF